MNFAGYAGRHVTHHVLKCFLLETGGTQIGASSADCLIRLCIGAPELAGRTDVHAGPAQTANFRTGIERGSNTPLLTAAAKSDGLSHHLFFAYTNAPATENAVLLLLSEALLANFMRRGEILNHF